MITRIELENFKGAGSRTRIDLAPVTLLFGANNAGKSTVLQSLLFVHEVLRRGTPDVDRTELGHEVVELGGFARMVHRHENDRAITIRIDFTARGTLNRLGRDLDAHPFPDLDDDIEDAWVELRAANHPGRALVDFVTIGSGDEPLVWIQLGPTLRDGEALLAQVNLGHPVLGERGREVALAWEDEALDVTGAGFGDGSGLGMGRGGLLDGGGFGDGRAVPVYAIRRERDSALPPNDEPIRLVPQDRDSSRSTSRSRSGPRATSMSRSGSGPKAASRSRSGSDADEATPQGTGVGDEIQTFLEMIILGVLGQLGDQLGKALYVGPLRAVPPRGSLYERTGRLSRWADGLAAWDALLADRRQLVESTNTWLARLEAGCKIVVQQLLDQGASAEDIAAEHVDATVRRLLLESRGGSLVLPSEVGAGISQVVPVIVASFFAAKGGLVMIEQPEIHVHPALQVGLGDLIIEASRDRQMIIETHSEHIVLRLLRRIRETSERELPEGAPSFSPDRLCVNYVETVDGAMQVRRLRVSDTGDFTDRWPHGFFEERAGELF